MPRRMTKRPGHYSLPRRANGQFQPKHEDTIRELERQSAAYSDYAKGLLLELLEQFQENEALLEYVSNKLKGRLTEIYPTVRTYCIENGLVRACPDCNGRLWLVEERRCQTCGGKGCLNY